MSRARRALAASAAALACLVAPAGAQAGSSVHVTVTGGPHAGSYAIADQPPCDFQAWKKPGASEPAMFVGSFAAEYPPGSRSQRAITPKDVGRIMLTIPSIRAPRPGVLDLRIVFGASGRRDPGVVYQVYTIPDELQPEISREIDGRIAPTGRGDVKVERSGDRAVIRFWGETAEGVRMEGTVTCARVVMEAP